MKTDLIEYDIYIPTVNEAGVALTHSILSEVQKDIVDFFGGLTDTRHRNEGVWKIGPQTVRDEIRVWRVLSDRGPAGDDFMANLRARLEAELEQDVILVVRRVVARI